MTRYDSKSARGRDGGIHPLAGMPQEALDAAVASYRSSTSTVGLDDAEIEANAHAVLTSALETIPNWDPSLLVNIDLPPRNVRDLDQQLTEGLDPVIQRAVLRGPMAMNLLGDHRLDPRVMHDVAHHGTLRQWRHLAANSNLPEDLQAQIFDSSDHQLNLGHAANPNLAERFREHLKKENNREVMEVLAANTKDEATQRKFVNRKEHAYLVDNPYATGRVLKALLAKHPTVAGELAGRDDLSPEMQLELTEFYDAHEPLSGRDNLTMEAALIVASLSGFVDDMVGGSLRPIEKWPVPFLRDGAPDKLNEAILYHPECESLQGLVDNWEKTFEELVEAAKLTQR